MNTLKLIIAGIAITTLAYSCSNDRDEEARQKAIEEVKNSNQKQKIKLNKSSLQSRDSEPAAINDSTRVHNSNSLGIDPNLDPKDGSEVVDPTKPDKPW